jgi:hypothetical protein
MTDILPHVIEAARMIRANPESPEAAAEQIIAAAEQRGRLAGLGDDEVIAESKIVEIADSFEKRTGQPSERWNTACDHIAQAIRDAKENEHG